VLKQLRYLHDLAQRNALVLLLSLPSGAGLAHELIAGVHGGQVLGGSARDMAQRQAGDLGVLACLGLAMGVADLAGLDAYLRRAVRAPTDSAPRPRRSRQCRPCTGAAASATFCMPCSMVSSDGVALGPVAAVQSGSNVR
jgi:hypothetical protein